MNTKVLEHGTRHHPSFVNALPDIVAEPEPVGYCHTCEGLAGQIRACERLGDRDGMLAYGWVAIRHVATHGESAGENIPAGIPGGAS